MTKSKKGAESNVNNNASKGSTECKKCTKSKASKESSKKCKNYFHEDKTMT